MKTLAIKKLATGTITFMVALFFLVNYGKAQVKLGAVSGLNLSNQSSNVESWDHSPAMGTTIGISSEVNLNSHLSMVLQTRFTGKGSNIEDNAQNDLVYEFRNKYAELPVLIRYSRGTKLKPFVQAGPYVAILLNSELGGTYRGKSISGDLKRVTQTFDAGIYAGLGVSYMFKNVTFSLEANYQYGFMNTLQAGTVDLKVGEQKTSGSINGIDVSKNRGYLISFGVSFPL
jgi:hypothetical protein